MNPQAAALLVCAALAAGCGGEAPANAPPASGAPAAPAPAPAAPASTILSAALHLHDGTVFGEPAAGPIAAGTDVDLVAVVRASRSGVIRSEIWLYSDDGAKTWKEIARATMSTAATREAYRVTTWTAPPTPGTYQVRFRIEEGAGDRVLTDQKDATFTVK